MLLSLFSHVVYLQKKCTLKKDYYYYHYFLWHLSLLSSCKNYISTLKVYILNELIQFEAQQSFTCHISSKTGEYICCYWTYNFVTELSMSLNWLCTSDVGILSGWCLWDDSFLFTWNPWPVLPTLDFTVPSCWVSWSIT